MNFVFNFTNVDLRKALGVPRFAAGMVRGLTCAGHYVAPVVDEVNASALITLLADETDGVDSDEWADRIVTHSRTEEIERFLHSETVEVLIHQFQSPLAPQFRNILVVHDFHAFTVPWKYGDPQDVQLQLSRAVHEASAVVTEFPGTYFDIQRHLGHGAHKTFLVPAPLLTPMGSRRRDASAQDTAAAEDPVQLLYPAQLQEHKNHGVLLSALRVLNRRQRVILTLTGTEYRSAVTAEINGLIDRLGLTDVVVQTGLLSDEDLVEYFLVSDAVVCASLAEGGAYLALEALCAGVPPIVADIPAARRHLRSVGAESAVTWFDPTDAADLAVAIAQGRSAPVPALPDLPTWDDFASEFSKIARHVLGQSPRPYVLIDADGRYLGLSTP